MYEKEQYLKKQVCRWLKSNPHPATQSLMMHCVGVVLDLTQFTCSHVKAADLTPDGWVHFRDKIYENCSHLSDVISTPTSTTQ